MIFPCPWAPYISTLCIISGIAQYLVHNNLSFLLDCQLLIFPMGHAAGQGTFYTHPGPRRGPFLKCLTCLKTLQKRNLKFRNF